MQTNQTALFELISQLEQIRTDFYNSVQDTATDDQATFENAISEAQLAIGSIITEGVVDQARAAIKEGR